MLARLQTASPAQAACRMSWQPLEVHLNHFPWFRRQHSRSPPSTSRVAAQAAKKQAKSKSSKQPGRAKAASSFEDLMVDWDYVFEAMCKDASRAQEMEEHAAQGFQQHGRGFLFVRTKVAKQSKKATRRAGQTQKGFGEKPATPVITGTPLENNPALMEQSWSAAFVPASYLASLGGIFSQGSVPLPDASQLISGSTDSSSSGPSGSSSTGANPGGIQDRQQGAAGAVEPSLVDELQRALRGIDAGRLALLVGCMDAIPADYRPSTEAAEPPHGNGIENTAGEHQGHEPAAEEASSSQAGWDEGEVVGGERPYEPEQREFVVLLLARVEGQPAIGADIVMAVTDEEGGTQLVLPGLQGLDLAFA